MHKWVRKGKAVSKAGTWCQARACTPKWKLPKGRVAAQEVCISMCISMHFAEAVNFTRERKIQGQQHPSERERGHRYDTTRGHSMQACFEHSLGESEVRKTLSMQHALRGAMRSTRGWWQGQMPPPRWRRAGGKCCPCSPRVSKAHVPQGETCSACKISKDSVRLFPCLLQAFCFLCLP